jgi:hypothetical protein
MIREGVTELDSHIDCAVKSTQAQEKDAALLDAMQANPRWHLDCEVLKFGKPGKWRVWKLLGNQMHSTSIKTLGEGDTPRAAIDSAIAASTAAQPKERG